MSTCKRKTVETVVIVRCIQCRQTREIRAGEVAKDDVPWCDKCWSPMVAESAKTVEKRA